ncbi:hypothetical protein RJT34_00947 [Clitoria ternatea]|uniref:Uncharacterized protein n=1 Tax=Clitoria ternatea TaxID=43366 RepID=A0AAN9Q317_CLITE
MAQEGVVGLGCLVWGWAQVIAIAQTGKHNDKRESYGDILIINPWRTINGRFPVPMAIALSGQLLLGQSIMVKPSEAEKNLVQHNASGVAFGVVGHIELLTENYTKSARASRQQLKEAIYISLSNMNVLVVCALNQVLIMDKLTVKIMSHSCKIADITNKRALCKNHKITDGVLLLTSH